eukprot:4976902-Alexandrium_andersonii.AAC.1
MGDRPTPRLGTVGNTRRGHDKSGKALGQASLDTGRGAPQPPTQMGWQPMPRREMAPFIKPAR